MEPDLLYQIKLKNADKVKSRRRLVVEQIVNQMKIFQDQRVDTSISKPAYIAEFSKCVNKKDSKPEIQKWLILNYLDNLNKAEKYFIKQFQRSIEEYKFVPNVGLAVCLDDQQALGRLFCFLPLPIEMPFRVSVHGYFAVSTNRRSLPADNEDLAVGSLARLKVGWNQYLFNQVLPSAWVELLHQLCSSHVIYNNSKEFYSLWPLFSSKRSSVNKFCKDILLNVVENIKVEDKVFFNESQTQDQRIFKILADLGFLVIEVPSEILIVLKESKNGSSIKFYSPRIVKMFFYERKYLLENIPRDKILIIFNYILGDDKSDYLDGLKMIPLSDGSLGTISTASSNEGEDEDCYYIGPDNNQVTLEYDERKIFKNCLAKFVDKEISSNLWNKLYNNAKTNRHGISNIKILNESVVAKMIKSNLANSVNYNEKYDEIKMHKNDNNQREWIYLLWDNLLCRKMFEFKHFENLHILPTNDDNVNITLRRLKTIQKCFCYSDKKSNSSPEEIIIILKSFGLVFVEKEFNENFAPKETRLENYVFNITDVVAKEMVSMYFKKNGLLIPNTNIKLVDINVVQFDNMPEADKDNDKSAHPRISLDMAKKLRLKMLNEVFIESVNLPFKSFEQSEPLTVRLKNIIESYPINLLFKEFLQNADDAKATEFCVFVDDRDFRSVNPGNNPKLISPEMYDWQGPALWIYNNAKFTKEDFQSFLELGVGGKKKDHSKIGRFGLGFNCAYHITDCPSFVSGKYIAFLDPHSKFLPAIGHPPTRQRGNILKFLEKSFGTHFQDQLLPYKGIKNCDFTKEFDGTLFRLPFRTQRLADMSKISNKVEGPDSIVELLSKIEGSREMIFLKNIKSFSVHRITDDDDDVDNPILIWKANIRLPIDLGSIRSTFININHARPFELCIEIESNVYECEDTVTSSEKWLICNGEEQKTLDMDLQNLSTGEGLKPRGGVAIFWAQAYEPLDKMHNGIHLEPPKLEGDIYVYLPLPIKTNLNVHLNGEFLVSNDRSSILQFDNNKSTQYGDSEEKIHRWNQHILQEILPTLHVKLLEDIAKRDHKRFIELKGDTSNFNVYTTTHFWPVINNDANFRIDTIYKQYGLKVLRKLIAKNSKIFWTEANGGKFVGAAEALLFDDKEDIDIHLFTQIGTPVVKLEEKKLKHFTMRFGMKFDHQLFDADMVCDLLKHVDKNLLDHQKIFKFLNFILITKAKSYEKLLKLPLVPLCNDDVGDFGESSYFIDQNGECKYLFPSAYSNSKFICSNLPSKLKKIFLEAEFSKTLKINEVDANAILDLIGYELPGRDFHWDPESDSIPNRTWLDRIWKNLMFTDYDYSKFKSYPLLPMTHPSRQLVLPNTEYPLLLIDNEEDLVFKVLTKLKVRFTDMAFPKFANPNLQHFVVEWNFTNVLKAIENVANISHLEIKGLFAQADLSDKDIEVIRLFVKKHFNLYGKSTKKERTFKPILDQLQIWPVHSSIKHNYVAVVDGLLLPKTFQNVSFQVDTNYFLTESDHEYSILVELGAKDSYDFLTQDLLPCIPDIPDQDCVQLLINVLLLNDPRIEDYFRYKQSGIPNKTLSEYRKANELYNENVPLFRSIFRESNRFLPDELQNHLQCLNVLRRMDFRNSVNGESLVECAEEILRNIQYEDTPFNVVKQKAEDLLKYFYHNTDLLRRDQLNRFLNIKFVPVAKNLDFPYKETVKSDIYYESLNSICFQRHRDLCWTQVCLIDPIIEPPSSFSISKLGFPKFRQIFNHLCHLSLKSREDNKDWISQYADKHILKSIKEIYTYLNDCLETISDDELQETFQTDEPVFLNSENPFTNSWKSGNQLVFGIREDINNNLCKVKPNLEPYKRLLKASGAKELNDIEPDVKVGEYSQREKLLNGLFDSLAGYPDTHHHDVIFKVGDEETNKMEEIGANRYVLSAASDHFKSMFCGGSKESIEFQKVYVELTDIKPEGFKIFLRWLYGQSLDELIDELAKKKTEVDDYESYYLKLLLGILKYSDMYFIDALKERLEEKILTGHYIEPNNVIEIKQWAEYYRANQLVKGCNQYIMKNEELITMQRNNDIGDADESS
ncbi:18417_t:CDS:10 [Entrophospora sp. SA101]|nr:18417_t:CDS:10 [Entrophospora sp. SA101]